jgi:signal peptidase II
MREVSNRGRKGLTGPRRYVAGGAFAAALIVADQVTKSLVAERLWPGRVVEVIPHLFNLALSRNTGGAFSLFPHKPAVFTVLSLAAVTLLCYLFTRLEGKAGASMAAAAIFAGAVGNLADRFRLGYVVDFVDLHAGPWHWYVFNVADAAITLGAISLFVLTFLDERRRKRTATEEEPTDGAGNDRRIP